MFFNGKVFWVVLGLVGFQAVSMAIILFLFFLYVKDTRSYIFKNYMGEVSAKTEIGKIYAYADDKKWISISDKIPKLTEVAPYSFCVELETQTVPDSAVGSIKISLSQSNRIVFQDSAPLKFNSLKMSNSYSGRIVFKDIDIPFKDILVEVTITIIKNGCAKSVSHTFHFKTKVEFEQHLETFYEMMGV